MKGPKTGVSTDEDISKKTLRIIFLVLLDCFIVFVSISLRSSSVFEGQRPIYYSSYMEE
jgi:hypothetical protein